MTSNNINEKNHVYHALCTRITHKVLSEKKTKEMSAKESLDMVNEMKKNPTKIRLSERNRNPKTAQEIYNKFEEKFHFVEKYGEIEFPNDDYSTRCEKIYQDALKEAVFRLGEMTRRKKNSLKINNKFYREYNNYNHYVTAYEEEKNLTFEYVEDPEIFEENEHGYKITKFECAFIIDEILSTGKQISNDEIYKELENIFKIKESKIYSDICKHAIRKIKKTLKDKGVDENILNIKELPGNKNAYRYDTEIGFSAFKACNYNCKEKNIAEFKEMATKLLAEKDIFPKDIDEKVQYLINILIQAKEDGRKQNFQTHIERLSKLKEERPKDWTRTYLDLLKNMKDEFKSLSSTILYADLLIEYADFILHYKIPEGYLPPDADIKNSVKKMYIKAIAKAKKHNDESRLIHYLVKYGEFLYSTEQHQTLHDVCCEAIELCESITGQKDIDREYGAALHLYARYLHDSEDYTEAENYYRKALDIRSRLAGYNKETLDETHTNRNDIADLSALSDTANWLGNLYRKMDKDEETMTLYEKSLKIRKKCARRRPVYKAQVACSYYNIGDLYIKSQDYRKALKYLGKAIDIEKNLVQKSPEDHYYSINYCWSLTRKADICISHHNDYEMAEKAMLEAVSVIKPLYEYNPKQYGQEYADALISLFLSYRLNTIEIDEVYLNNALEALSIYKKSNSNQSSNDKIAAINTLIADTYISKGKRDEAEKHSHEALDSLRIINTKRINFQSHLNLIVMVMQQTESYDNCKPFADKATTIMNHLCAEINNLQHYKIEIYNAKKEIAKVYRRVNEYDKAIAIYKELENCYIEPIDGTVEYASLLSEIANCYYDIGDKDKYKEYLHSSIIQYESLMEKGYTLKTEIARDAMHLAFEICMKERYDESYPLYEKAISLLNDSYKYAPKTIITALGMAHMYYALALEKSDKTKAFEHYNLSLKYAIENPSDLENIKWAYSQLDRFILTSNLPKDTDKELIHDTIVLMKICQIYGIEVYSIDILEDLLNGE